MASDPTSGARGSSRQGARDRMVLLTNTPTPYRTSFFDVLSDVLAERDCALRVLYFAAREPNRRWNVDLGAARHDHRILPGLHVTLRDAYIHFNPGVLGELRARPPRWLVVGGAWHLPTALLAIASRPGRRASRILWSEGHADAVLHAGGPIAAVRGRVYRRYQAFAVPNARSGRYAVEQAGSERPILPLANTVDEEFFRPPDPAEAREARASLGIAPGERVLVTLCQLIDRKGVLELARAFRGLAPASSGPRRLVFLGDGERRRELEEIARDARSGAIQLAGHLAMPEVRRWLWAANGFVLATRSDPNPLSPIEASLTGLPLLLSSLAGNVDELLVEAETGWRFDLSTRGSLDEALSRFFSVDAADLDSMGRAAARHTGASFRRRAVAERFVDATFASFPRSAQR